MSLGSFYIEVMPVVQKSIMACLSSRDSSCLVVSTLLLVLYI